MEKQIKEKRREKASALIGETVRVRLKTKRRRVRKESVWTTEEEIMKLEGKKSGTRFR